MKNQMKHLPIALAMLALSTLNPQLSTARAQGTAFTYQGRLNDGTNPATGIYDLRFTIYDSAGAGALVAGPLTNAATSISNGLFTATLDFGAGPFTGADLWLEIAARSGTNPFAPLNPRQLLTPAPYAISAANLMSPAATPLNISVNGARALRIEPTATSPNLIGGYQGNSVVAGADAAVIAGGGRPGAPNYAGDVLTFIGGGEGNTNSGGGAFLGGGFFNQIESGAFDAVLAGGHLNVIHAGAAQSTIAGGLVNTISNNAAYATIGGGQVNVAAVNEATVAGGAFNSALGYSSTIGGGGGNSASGVWSVIAGGRDNLLNGADYASIGGGHTNTIQMNAYDTTIAGGGYSTIQSNAIYSTIGGGFNNTIQTTASYSTIGGGYQNSAAGLLGTVPGGQFNVAGGLASFAAGNRAKANHDGSFVWADVSAADFASTAPNQFLIRASGGVGIGKTNPATALDVNGTVTASALSGLAAAQFWGTSGNTGTIAGIQFLGTLDNQALEFKVNNTRALRLEPGGVSPNVIGGFSNNAAAFGVSGVTIAGGGIAGGVNVAGDNFATVGGGYHNSAATVVSTVCGGYFNTASNTYAAVVAGAFNSASGFASFVGGGGNNFATGNSATVAGGNNSYAIGDYSTVGGGAFSSASGYSSTVPGGYNNQAAGDYSFAAGRQAAANHPGAFVWADSTGASFASSASNQFLIRASGGVGIGKNNPATALDVNGTVNASVFSGSGATLTLGTTDNHPLELKVNNARVLRLEPNATSPNLIGGFSGNVVSNGFAGATIAGGGALGSENRVGANDAAVSGGSGNVASGNLSAIGGGLFNSSSGAYATIPGGQNNTAAGEFSLAAGRDAVAQHDGAFVWADSLGASFVSTSSNQFDIRATGGVGIGTPNPQGSVHVYSDNNPTIVRIQSTGTPGFGRLEFVSNPQGDTSEWRPGFIQSLDAGGFTGGLGFYVNGTGIGNRFATNEVMRIVNGRVGIGTNNPSALLQVGSATCNGTTWANASDRNAKENFKAVDAQEVLAKVTALPLSRWNYKEDRSSEHLGPMAQDFYAAFNVGPDDKHITTVDEGGVALAAIQGLNQKLEAALDQKETEVTELKQRLAALEKIVLSQKSN